MYYISKNLIDMIFQGMHTFSLGNLNQYYEITLNVYFPLLNITHLSYCCVKCYDTGNPWVYNHSGNGNSPIRKSQTTIQNSKYRLKFTEYIF